MKASEMTNEDLADWVARIGSAKNVCLLDEYRGYLDEAAARLRRPTPVDDDLLKMAGDIDKLTAKLKVAEDALELAWMYASKLPHQWPLPERVRAKMRNALAAIREDGGEK